MTSGPKAAKFKDSDYLQTLLSVCISLLKLLEKKNPKKPLITLMRSFVMEMQPVQEMENSIARRWRPALLPWSS